MKYSITKGLSKGAVSALTVAAAMVMFAGFADFTLWQLLEQYLKPVLGSVTIGGVITMALNYLKVRNQV